MDGITFYHICRELDARLSGARVDKIQQPERDELILTLRCPGENLMLLLSASADCGRAQITDLKKSNPLEPPQLCMLMRKHLIGGRLMRVRQLNADRVLCFEFEHTDELGDRAKKQLICEFMGKHSNLILLDAGGRIMESARRINESISSYREVLPGLPYLPPPPHEKECFDCLSTDTLRARLSGKSGMLAKLLQSNISGLGLPPAQELAFRICGRTDAQVDDAGMYAEKICEAVKAVLAEPSPRILLSPEGEALQLLAFPYLSRSGEPFRTYATLSEAMDDYFVLRDKAERIRQKSAAIHRVLKTNQERLQKKLLLQQEAYDDAARSEEYRIKGEMLTAGPHLVKKGMKQVMLPNYYDENCALMPVELDEKLSASANAQRYFKLYRKAQVARKLAGEQLAQGREELAYLEGQLYNLSVCAEEAELAELRQELIKTGYIRDLPSRRQTKALPPSKPREFTAPDGTRILAGRNNVQNEALTFSSQPDEVWLHAKGVPGSHVIIKSDHPDRETLLYAAGIAAALCAAAASPTVEVDTTRRRYVKKPSGARPGFVTYTHQTTLAVHPLEEAKKPV